MQDETKAGSELSGGLSAVPMPNEAARVRLRLIERLEWTLAKLEHGCLDGGCDMVRPSPGMHTNGGCHCWYHMDRDLFECAVLAESLKLKSKRCW